MISQNEDDRLLHVKDVGLVRVAAAGDGFLTSDGRGSVRSANEIFKALAHDVAFSNITNTGSRESPTVRVHRDIEFFLAHSRFNCTVALGVGSVVDGEDAVVGAVVVDKSYSHLMLLDVVGDGG